MSNLSDIGFPIAREEDVNQVIMDVMGNLKQFPAPPYGYYYLFEDESGAQLYLQTNGAQDLIGFNPSFRGDTEFLISNAKLFERESSVLDGAVRAKIRSADDQSEIVFDVPNYRTVSDKFAIECVNLTAFASNDLEYKVKHELPAGSMTIFEAIGSLGDDGFPPSHANISGEISNVELRKNTLRNENFYSLRIRTSGGEIDVVADPKLFKIVPEAGGTVSGSFWLSGKICR
ncbi:MAG: hypothetical protein ACK5NT_06010 [Pyrinomonadaceae bacterium]